METFLVGVQEELKVVETAYEGLVQSIRVSMDEKDRKNIREAYEIALKAHSSQRRKSGDPYILHPIAVARICAEEIGLGPTGIICALLHDVVEDTEITLSDIENKFGVAFNSKMKLNQPTTYFTLRMKRFGAIILKADERKVVFNGYYFL
jgi:GTP pyrophosphokinase